MMHVLHRGLFQVTVGSICRMGSVGECCPLLFPFELCHNHRVLLFQVLFCSDLKKFQKLKEPSHLKQSCKMEDTEAEMREKKTLIKTE